jgi:hypothetical protein
MRRHFSTAGSAIGTVFVLDSAEAARTLWRSVKANGPGRDRVQRQLRTLPD